MRRQRRQTQRFGAALMAVLVTLGVVSALMVAITWQIVANRRLLEQRHNRLQADLCARAGVELAAANLLTNPAGYKGETADSFPLAKVQITVERPKDNLDIFTITSEARYPTDAPNPVVRSVSRRFRRVMEGDKVRLVPAEESRLP